MKKLILVLLLCAAPIVITQTGCKTQSQQTVVYKSILTIETTVDVAYKSYLDLVVNGKLSTSSVHNISQNYQTFQDGVKLAIAAAQGNTNAVAPQALIDAGATVISNISLAKKGTK